MKRRHFLIGAAATAANLLTPDTSRSQSDIGPHLAVSYEDPGQAIALDFIGLSYESAILAGADYFTPNNASTLGLIRALGENGVIRIGGNTSERTVWGVDAKPVGPASLVIAPANIDRLAAALRVLGWKLIYGLNLARGSPAEAADEAAYVANAVGTNLLAFQIGNEPDGFGRWTGVRPASYDVSAYLAEWRTFHASIRARVPSALFAGPDVSGATDWVAAFAEAMSEGLVLLTHHYYADGPAGAPHVSLPKLLQSSRQLPPLLERLAQYSRRYRWDSLRKKARKPMAKSRLALVTPATVIGTVEPHRRPPKRVHNAEVRAREYLTNAEVDRLVKAAGANRNGHRDATMVLVAYRHGLRPVELVALRWDAIDFAHGQIHVSRAKNGAPSVHPFERCRTTGAAPAQARPGAAVAVRVHVRARRALHDGGVAQDGVAAGRRGQAGLQGPPTHVPARLRFSACQPGHRHTHPASVPRPSQHPAHRALHRTVAHALQEPLARLTIMVGSSGSS